MPTDKKTIKSYSNYATNWAKKMRNGENHTHKFLEKPAMYKKLPNLEGKIILCIGCGTGEECEYLFQLGAKKVIGIDASEGVVELARRSYPYLEFHVMDMEKINFSEKYFDFVYSSLVIHYLKDWKPALREIYRVLKKKGVFLFSINHPIKSGAIIDRSYKKVSFLLGYEKYTSGAWQTFGDYLKTRKVTDTWFGKLTISYYHRPLSNIIRDIIQSGFTISDFIEPKPTKSAIKKRPDFYDIHTKVPPFMIFELKK